MADIPETITPEWVQSNDMASKLLRQFEFYFSDSNLPRDKFLKAQYAAHEDGVLLSTLASFKRVQQLSTDLEFITNVVATSDGLVLSEDRSRVKRAHPLPSDPKAYLPRSLYAKGFQLTMSLDDLIAYFSQYGKVRGIRMRRNYQVQEHNGFKGSVFVEFDTPEIAEKVLTMELKVKNDKDEEVPLLLKKQADYMAEKSELFKNKRRRSDHSSADAPDAKANKVERTYEKGVLMRIANIKPDTTRETLKVAVCPLQS
jgi:lupus La protein